MNTEQTTEGATLRILAVDISNIFRRSWEAAQGKEFSEAHNRTLQAVAKHREGHDRVAVCCDGGRSFRKSISPQYKADRSDPGEAYREQLRRTIERLRADGATVFESPQVDGGFAEADDVIGSLCRWALDGGHNVSILSSDKDVLACVTSKEATPRICRIKPDSGEAQYAEDLQAMVGIVPAQVPEWLALAGDDSDGFKPYKGLGPKSAMKLLTKYGSLPVVFKASAEELAAVLENKPLAERIAAAGPEPAMTALRLSTLACDLFIDFDPLLAEPQPEGASDTHEDPAMPPAAVRSLAPAQPVTPQVQQQRRSELVRRVAVLPYWAQDGYLDKLWEVSRAFHAAGCFPNVGKVEQVMVVAMIAHEARIGLATAMQHAYFVHGRLGWSATWMLMRVEASGLCEKFEIQRCDDKACYILVKRRGRPERVVKWEWVEAERAGLTKPSYKGEPSNWMKWPQDMNLARCIARAARQEFRAQCGGMYIIEELAEEIPEDAMLERAREARQMIAAPAAQRAA